MTLTDEQKASLLEAARPLLKWMNENTNPHCEVRVDTSRVELVSGVHSVPCMDYVKD